MDAAVVVIDLEAESRKAREQRIDMVVNIYVQKRGLHIAVLGKIVNARAVGDDAGGVAGQVLSVAHEGGQGATGGDGKVASVLDEILDGLAVAFAHRRHILTARKRALGVNKRVVKVAGQQHLVEFRHDRHLADLVVFSGKVYHSALQKKRAGRRPSHKIKKGLRRNALLRRLCFCYASLLGALPSPP